MGLKIAQDKLISLCTCNIPTLHLTTGLISLSALVDRVFPEILVHTSFSFISWKVWKLAASEVTNVKAL